MRPEDVPQEWVALMVAASMEYQARRLGLPGNVWTTYKTEEGDRIATEAMRAALAAVAPLIAAAEREACAKVADAHKQQYRKEQSQFPRNPARWQHYGDAAQTLAAAIRARGAA